MGAGKDRAREPQDEDSGDTAPAPRYGLWSAPSRVEEKDERGQKEEQEEEEGEEGEEEGVHVRVKITPCGTLRKKKKEERDREKKHRPARCGPRTRRRRTRRTR